MISLAEGYYQNSFAEKVAESIARSPSLADARLELLSLSHEYTVHSNKQTPKVPEQNFYLNSRNKPADVTVRNPFLQTLGGWEQRQNSKLRGGRIRFPNQLHDLAIVSSNHNLIKSTEDRNKGYQHLFRGRRTGHKSQSVSQSQGVAVVADPRITVQQRQSHRAPLFKKKDPTELLQEFYEGENVARPVDDSKSKSTVGFLITSKSNGGRLPARKHALFSSVQKPQQDIAQKPVETDPRFRSASVVLERMGTNVSKEAAGSNSVQLVDPLIAERIETIHLRHQPKRPTNLLEILKMKQTQPRTVKLTADGQIVSQMSQSAHNWQFHHDHADGSNSEQLLALDYHHITDYKDSRSEQIFMRDSQVGEQILQHEGVVSAQGLGEKGSKPVQPEISEHKPRVERANVALLGPKKFSLPLNSLIKQAGDQIILDSKLFPGEVNPITVASLHHPFSPWLNVVMNQPLNLEVVGQSDLVVHDQLDSKRPSQTKSMRSPEKKQPSESGTVRITHQPRPSSRFLRSDRMKSVDSKRVYPYVVRAGETPEMFSSQSDTGGLQDLVKKEIRDIIEKKFIKIHTGSPRLKVESLQIHQISDEKYTQLCRKGSKSPPPKSTQEARQREERNIKVQSDKLRLHKEHQHKLALFLQRKYLGSPGPV